MKRLTLVVILIGLLICAVVAVPVAAQEADPSAAVQEADLAAATALTYTSCFQLQNLSGSASTAAIVYYPQDGSAPITVNDTVPANGSKTYCPLGVSSPFKGSVVVSSETQLAAVVNVTGTTDWSGFDASYAGFSAGSTTVSIPLLMKGNFGYNTLFNIQNAGGSTATVNISYSDGTSTSKNIEPNRAVTLDQSAETHSQTVFAATLTSNQPVVATVLEVGPTMLFAYDGFTGSSTNPVMPLVQANNYGYTTGIQVQNAGATATTVTVSYTPSLAGTACTQQKTIAGHASETFAISAWASGDPNSDNNCVNGATFIGSAKVTGNSASQGLVAIVNQHNFSLNKGAAYGGFDPASATSKVVMPLIMDRNFGYFTGFSVQNVGAQPTTVNCTFTGNPKVVNDTLNPGEALTSVQLNQLASGYVGAATCTATGGDAKIIGVVNELVATGNRDTFLVYEAFSATP